MSETQAPATNVAGTGSAAEPMLVEVKLKRSVERFGFVYKPGLVHRVTEALAAEFGDAVIKDTDVPSGL